MNEAKIQVGDQWFYRGNRANSWFATYRDGGGLSDRVPTVCWPFLEEIARLQSAKPESEAPKDRHPMCATDGCELLIPRRLVASILERCHDFVQRWADGKCGFAKETYSESLDIRTQIDLYLGYCPDYEKHKRSTPQNIK